ncbi:hypothetical protein ACFWOY_14170 [Streptomyces sp. NPDC058423]|uniref:hypothetical protein n=1 Tax=unclassified Streptomyces TaxID=2593676 RepID=UPI00364FA924
MFMSFRLSAASPDAGYAGAIGGAARRPVGSVVRQGRLVRNRGADLYPAGKKVIKVAVSSGATTRTAVSGISSVAMSISFGWATMWRSTTG